MDVFLRSLLMEPIFLAGLLGFLLENTIPGKLRLDPSRLGSGQEVITPWVGQWPHQPLLQAHGLSEA